MKQETDAKLAGLQDAEVGQGWTDNKDIIDHLKHDPYFVQGEADNKDVDVGHGVGRQPRCWRWPGVG